MPFASKAQARFLYANEPKLAREFASKTKSVASLPEKVKKARDEAKKKKNYDHETIRKAIMKVEGRAQIYEKNGNVRLYVYV